METPSQQQTPEQKQRARYNEYQAKYGKGEMSLLEMMEFQYCQKQLDDLFLAEQATLQAMKGADKFNPKLIQRRDVIQHDIGQIQPLVAALGTRFGRHIAGKYSMSFRFLTGGADAATAAEPDTEQKPESKILSLK